MGTNVRRAPARAGHRELGSRGERTYVPVRTERITAPEVVRHSHNVAEQL